MCEVYERQRRRRACAVVSAQCPLTPLAMCSQAAAEARLLVTHPEQSVPLLRGRVVTVIDVEGRPLPYPIQGRVVAISRDEMLQVKPDGLGGAALVRLQVEGKFDPIFHARAPDL